MGKYLLAAIFGAIFGAYICALVISESLSTDRSPAHQKGKQAEGQQSQPHSPIAANVAQAVASDDADGNSNQEADAPDRVLDWMGRFLVDIKITDVLLVIFTMVLAEKTAGLFTETAGMRTAAEGQSRDMQNSIREAGRSATAMEGVAVSMARNVEMIKETVETNKSIAEGQKAMLRAYISVVIGDYYRQVDNIARLQIHPKMINTGNTPARNIILIGLVEIRPFPPGQHFDFTLPGRHDEASAITLGSRQDVSMPLSAIRYFSADEVREAELGVDKRVYAFGRIEYDDAFGHPHFTNFCYSTVWSVQGKPIGQWTRHHNDSD